MASSQTTVFFSRLANPQLPCHKTHPIPASCPLWLALDSLNPDPCNHTNSAPPRSGLHFWDTETVRVLFSSVHPAWRAQLCLTLRLLGSLCGVDKHQARPDNLRFPTTRGLSHFAHAADWNPDLSRDRIALTCEASPFSEPPDTL